MKKTNIILGVVIAIFIIIAIVILTVAFMKNTEKETIPVNVDFETLSSNIEEITSMDKSKMKQITIDDLQNEFNINPDWVNQVIGVKPYVNISSSMYVILEVKEEYIDNVITALKEYGNKYDDMWKDYLAEEYELVKNRQIGAKGNYVYFIVSDYAKDIIDLIK